MGRLGKARARRGRAGSALGAYTGPRNDASGFAGASCGGALAGLRAAATGAAMAGRGDTGGSAPAAGPMTPDTGVGCCADGAGGTARGKAPARDGPSPGRGGAPVSAPRATAAWTSGAPASSRANSPLRSLGPSPCARRAELGAGGRTWADRGATVMASHRASGVPGAQPPAGRRLARAFAGAGCAGGRQILPLPSPSWDYLPMIGLGLGCRGRKPSQADQARGCSIAWRESALCRPRRAPLPEFSRRGRSSRVARGAPGPRCSRSRSDAPPDDATRSAPGFPRRSRRSLRRSAAAPRRSCDRSLRSRSRARSWKLRSVSTDAQSVMSATRLSSSLSCRSVSFEPRRISSRQLTSLRRKYSRWFWFM